MAITTYQGHLYLIFYIFKQDEKGNTVLSIIGHAAILIIFVLKILRKDQKAHQLWFVSVCYPSTHKKR